MKYANGFDVKAMATGDQGKEEEYEENNDEDEKDDDEDAMDKDD